VRADLRESPAIDAGKSRTKAERRACEIWLRAERKAGQLLQGMEKLKGRPAKASSDTRLSDLGISHDQSSKWQRLADVPDEQFEAAVAGQDKPSTNGIIRAGRNASEPLGQQCCELAGFTDAKWVARRNVQQLFVCHGK
jgi:hypothetical protein